MSNLIPLFRQYLVNAQEAAKGHVVDPGRALELLNKNVEITMVIYGEFEKEE